LRPISLTLVGSSPSLHALRQDISHAGRCDAKVLLQGESGSGKEIVAHMIHSASRRHKAPMVTVNCAAVAETLLETELFGHVRGSFTGAYRDRLGVFEAADGGTVLLDEVGEMSPRMQGMLLRFLETGEVQRVGSDDPHRRVNVRVIAATHRTLRDSVEAKTFREDLYYRLNILQIRVPPLREHAEDVPELLNYWLEHFRSTYQTPPLTLSREAIQALSEYQWPGNVRELRNVLERLVSRGFEREVNVVDLPPEIIVGSIARVATARPAAPKTADVLFDRMVKDGESFWSVAYQPFMSRDLTRDDLRGLVKKGLTHTFGSYRLLVQTFNMPPDDYKKFLAFLHKYQCYMPFQQFRSASIKTTQEEDRRRSEGPEIAARA
jgi:transcriptional regulator with PAS, ATPase and Fis domain